MTRYRLAHRPDLGTFDFACLAVLAGLFAGLLGSDLDWIATK